MLGGSVSLSALVGVGWVLRTGPQEAHLLLPYFRGISLRRFLMYRCCIDVSVFVFLMSPLGGGGAYIRKKNKNTSLPSPACLMGCVLGLDFYPPSPEAEKWCGWQGLGAAPPESKRRRNTSLGATLCREMRGGRDGAAHPGMSPASHCPRACAKYCPPPPPSSGLATSRLPKAPFPQNP